MVTTAAGVEWTVVSTEVEALQLEYAWIKEFDPRFNVKYRDDKSYPYLAVTMGEEFPRVQVMRGRQAQGHPLLRPVRPRLGDPRDARPAAAGVPGPHLLRRGLQAGRPGRAARACSATSTSAPRRASAGSRRRSTAALAEDFCDFMAGQTRGSSRRLEAQMREAASEQEYERAARLRDDLGALRRALEKNAVVLPDGTDADVFALAEDELEAAVQVFHVRGGRVRGQRGWVVEKVEDVTTGDLVEQLLQQVYGEALTAATTSRREGSSAVPREVLVPTLPHRRRPGLARG